MNLLTEGGSRRKAVLTGGYMSVRAEGECEALRGGAAQETGSNSEIDGVRPSSGSEIDHGIGRSKCRNNHYRLTELLAT